MSSSNLEAVEQTNNACDKVRSLWVPLREMNLLVPNMVVAEIGSYRLPVEIPGTPEWLLGMVKWREHEIAVISMESLCGLTVPSNPVFSRLMIVNSIRANSSVDYYGIVTAGLPGLLQFGNDTADNVDVYDLKGVHCVVQVGNERAAVPDLDCLQEMLEQYLDKQAA